MTAFATLDDFDIAFPLLNATVGQAEFAVQAALDAACDEIRKRTSQTFDFVEEDEIVLDGSGTQGLLLPELPVVAVNEVTLDKDLSTELVVTDYVVGFAGVLRRRKGWPWGYGNITVEYDHGYETIPSDLVNVAVQRARAIYLASPPGLRSESIDGYSYTADDSGAALDPWASILDLHTVRRVPVP